MLNVPSILDNNGSVVDRSVQDNGLLPPVWCHSGANDIMSATNDERKREMMRQS